MRKYSFIILCLAAILATSCTTLRKTSTTADIETNIQQYPTVADLDINPQKVEKSYTWNWNPFTRESSLTVQKSNLVADLLKEHDGDVLLEPQFIFHKVAFGQRVLTVSGFTAKFKDFRKATDKDLKAIEATKCCAVQEKCTYVMQRCSLFGKKKK